MSARKPRVYVQGASTYVIGTSAAHEACRVLGISPETHRWGGTHFGYFVRRQGLWRSRGDAAPLPLDARPGACFVGGIRPTAGEGNGR